MFPFAATQIMTQQNRPGASIDVRPRLTTDIFGTASLLQRQVHALEERCRASEEQEDRLKKTRSELQAILSKFATVEKAEVHATADLIRTLERLRSGNGASPSFTITPPRASAAISSQGECMSPAGSTPSILPRVARVTLRPRFSSPRGPSCPSLLFAGENAEADPHSEGHQEGAGAGSHPTDALQESEYVAADDMVAEFLKSVTSDGTRAVGQRGCPEHGAVARSPRVDGADLAQVYPQLNGRAASQDPRTRLDPRLRPVSLSAQVVSPARLGGDAASMMPSAQSLTDVESGESDLPDTNSLLAVALAGGSNDSSGAALPGLVDRIGSLDIAPEQPGPGGDIGKRARAVQVFKRNTVVRKLAGNWPRSTGGSQGSRKGGSPARKRPFRVRAKSTIVGPQTFLVKFVRRAPAARPGTPVKE
ncbi:hypothetical protein PYCCODRAFT_1466745 [Trametes coccinea BRFM310]|uniref:Uncharacterized protein n=1 Tax=Trametes coccinea (strain BRFM310) TaxID=1353009 RepID=A0A1Y2IRU3_TRAC3|nr:hypothetical protein PYCCODRAFT_1466745 [Trametes coccinea BRFM310]